MGCGQLSVGGEVDAPGGRGGREPAGFTTAKRSRESRGIPRSSCKSRSILLREGGESAPASDAHVWCHCPGSWAGCLVGRVLLVVGCCVVSSVRPPP